MDREKCGKLIISGADPGFPVGCILGANLQSEHFLGKNMSKQKRLSVKAHRPLRGRILNTNTVRPA